MAIVIDFATLGENLLHVLQFLAYHRAACLRLHHGEAGGVIVKRQHLQHLMVLKQTKQLLGNQLFRPNVIRHIKDVLIDFAFILVFIRGGNRVHQFGLAHTGYRFWRVVQTRSQLAGNEIGFIVTSQSQEQIAVFDLSGL